MQANRPFPWYKGPKLPPFRFRDDSRRNIAFLDDLGGGLHAEVFKAVIDDSVYAVKLVCLPSSNATPASRLGLAQKGPGSFVLPILALC